MALPFPALGENQQPQIDRLNHVVLKCRDRVSYMLAGYAAPDPYFGKSVTDTVESLMRNLRDPQLPLLELHEVISTVSGRLPQMVERAIRQQLQHYSSNITSVLCQFPSQPIANIIDSYAATLQKRSDRDVFFLNTQGRIVIKHFKGNFSSFILSRKRERNYSHINIYCFNIVY